MFRKMMGTIFLWIVVISVSFAQKSADELMDQVWEAAASNNRAQMETTLHQLLKMEPNNIRANLALYFLYTQNGDNASAFEILKKIPDMVENYPPYIHALLVDGPFTEALADNNKEAVKFAENLIGKGDPSGILTAMMMERLGTHYKSIGKFKKADALFSRLKVVPNWQIIGPFNNISASGFNKKFPVESEFIPEKIYKGDNGIPLKWRKISLIRSDKWLDYTNYSAKRPAIWYANNFISSPEKKRVQFRIGTSGSLKFFVNDVEVLSVFDENNNDLDTYIVEADLQKGWNRILIKTGNSEIDNNNFMVRITDGRGNLPRGLTSSPLPQKYPSGAPANAKRIPVFAEEFFKKQIDEHPDYMENYLLLAKDYLRNDKASEAEKVLREALNKMPDATILLNDLLEVYIRDGRQDQLISLLEKMHKLDPDLITPLVYRIDQAIHNEDTDTADELIAKLIDLQGETEISIRKRLLLEDLKDNASEAVKLIYRAHLKYPNNLDFLIAWVGVETKINKNYEGAIKEVKKFLKNHPWPKVYSVLTSLYLSDMGIFKKDPNKWEETFKKIFEIEPQEVYYYFILAKYHFRMHQYEECIKWLDKAASLAPTISEIYNLQGKALKNIGNKEQAIEKLKQAIVYSGTNYDARESLRELEGKKNIFSNFKSYPIEKLIQEAPDASADQGKGAIVLLDYVKRVVYPEGASESAAELLVKVYNSRGIDAFKEYWIDYSPSQEDLIIEKAVVMKTNGTEIKGDTEGGHVVFKSLESNDCIYIKYKKKNYYSGKLSRHFWDNYQFNGFFPIRDVHYALMVPSEFQFKYSTHNFDAKPSIKITDDGKIYEWSKKNVPSMKFEDYMPPTEDVGDVLYISSIPDWNYIARWYNDLAGTKTRSSIEIKEKINELFEGKNHLDKDEKIKAIYHYINENIHYSSVPFRQSGLIPQKARDVLVTRIGDCKDMATLAIAMLREVGVEAKFALVNTRQYGQNINALPSINFNHCIVAIPQDSGQYKFLDMTAKNYPYGVLPRLDKEAFSLVIDENTQKPLLLPAYQDGKSVMKRKTEIEIAENNQIHVKTESYRKGTAAAIFRHTYRNKREEKKVEILAESLNGIFTNPQIDSFQIRNLEKLDEPVYYNFQFSANSIATNMESFLIVSLPWLDQFRPKDALSHMKREYPYFYWPSRDWVEETITLKLPEGFRPVELPKTVRYSSAISDYVVSYSYSKGKITATRKLINKKREVSTEEYVEFRQFYNNVIKEDRRKILLKK